MVPNARCIGRYTSKICMGHIEILLLADLGGVVTKISPLDPPIHSAYACVHGQDISPQSRIILSEI